MDDRLDGLIGKALEIETEQFRLGYEPLIASCSY